MDRAPVVLSAYWRLVRGNRNFRRLWFAQIVSEMGDWIYTVAIYSLLLELTGSARSVAIAVVLQVLPQVFVAPMAGVVNDRISRKRVMIGADLARAAIVLGMLFAGRAEMIWAVYLLLLLETMMWGFFEPGRSAIVPNITTPSELVAANTLGSITWSLNLALGSGLGGVVAALLGRDAVFILNSVSFLLSAALLRGMRFPEPHLDRARPLRARDLLAIGDMAEGVQYVARDRRLLALLLVKAGLGFMGTHWVLLPIFGERVFPVGGLDPRRGAILGMSLLMASRGIGALLGPFVAGYWAGQRHRRLRAGILIGFLLTATGYSFLAGAPSVWIAAATIVLAHAGGSIVWVFSTTLLQFHTEDRFRGRVFSADFAFLTLAMSAASYAAGVLVDVGMPVRLLAVATGGLAFIPAVLWCLGGMRQWPSKESASSK